MDVPSRLLLNAAPRPNGLVAAAMTKLRPSGSTGTQSRESDGRERHHPPSYLHAPLEPLPKNLISRSHEPASRRHGQPWPALKPRRTMTLLQPPPGLLETSTSPRRPPPNPPPPPGRVLRGSTHARSRRRRAAVSVLLPAQRCIAPGATAETRSAATPMRLASLIIVSPVRRPTRPRCDAIHSVATQGARRTAQYVGRTPYSVSWSILGT